MRDPGASRARVVILTPADDASAPQAWHAGLARMARALSNAGMEVRPCAWDRWQGDEAELALPLLAWGYHLQWPEFRRKLAQWGSLGAAVRNPVDMLRWNADKRYLLGLRKDGIPAIATSCMDTLDAASLHALARDWRTDVLVVKPSVSASAWRTFLWRPGEDVPSGAGAPSATGWVVQPFRSEIRTQGELSLVCFDGAFSHAVRKTVVVGDGDEFRVQSEYGGAVAATDIDARLADLAKALLRRLACVPLYARIDLVLTPQPLLMELELIEPELFLQHHPEAPARFAAAVSAAAHAHVQMEGRT